MGWTNRLFDLLDGMKSADADSLVTISSFHAKGHEGKAFLIQHLFSAIADDASADLALTTGSGPEQTHVLISAVMEGKSEVFFYEAPTFTVGTGVTAFNRERASATVSGVVAVHTPTVTDVGTELSHGFIPAGGKHDPGAGAQGFSEWILKADTKYLLRVTNRSGAAIDVLSALHFYED